MTAVGKILVFLNLVFSLVVGGFVVFTYVARVHWVEAGEGWKREKQVMEANNLAYQNEAAKAKQDAAALTVAAQKELKLVQGDLAAVNAANADLSAQLKKLKEKSTNENALASASVTEVEKRQQDVAKLRDTLRKEQDLNNTLVKQNAEFRNAATVAQIERRAVQDQNNRLECSCSRWVTWRRFAPAAEAGRWSAAVAPRTRRPTRWRGWSRRRTPRAI